MDWRYAVTAVVVFCASVAQGEVSTRGITTIAREALLIDLSTGAILFEKNAGKRMAPSSMTKIATIYQVFKELRDGHLKLDTLVPVSENAARKPGSRMFLKPFERVRLEDLLKGAVIISGNDACCALAEFIGGAEDTFAELVNESAREIGATDTHFVNASGLPDPKHWTTCWDLARISERLLKDFPKEYKRYFGIQEFAFNGIKQRSKNTLLREKRVDGIKTGMTDLGKFGMVASAEKEGRRLLLVVNGIESEGKRAQEVDRLLSWGFLFSQPCVLFRAKDKVIDVPVWHCPSVCAVTPRLVGISVPTRLRHQMVVSVRYSTPLIPPVRKGQRVGTLVVSIPKQCPLEFPLLAGDDMVETGIWNKILSWVTKKENK